MKKLKVGDVVTVKKFAYDNPCGGTSMAEPDPKQFSQFKRFKYDTLLKEPVKIRITKTFFDYETGTRIIGELLDGFMLEGNSNQNKVYVSQFDIV